MRRRAERLALGAVVLVLHALLLWAWRAATVPHREQSTSAPAVLVLRLITPAPVREPSPPATLAQEPARPPPRSATPVPVRRAETAAGITAAPMAEAPPEAASAPHAAALSLPGAAMTPPRAQSMRDQMLNDPRSNSPRATVESRIAALNGPDHWEVEPMDATRSRWRRNGRCIEVHEARNAQIDPYNQTFSPTPKAVKPCD
jgi:hypothetical protein